MLVLKFEAGEFWDELKEEFVYFGPSTLSLEHSLVSLQKWESKWHKPYYSKSNKTEAEVRDYIRCMTVTPNVDESIYNRLTPKHFSQIQQYIDDPMTATWFTEDKRSRPNREQITAELIYYWMTEFNIPPEYRKWHLNQLITLIRVCSIKKAPPEKMSKADILKSNAALNKARRKKHR